MTTSPCRAPDTHHASCLCALSGVVYNPPTDSAPVPAELPALQRVVLGHLAPDRGVTTSRLAQAMAQPHHAVQTALDALHARKLIRRGTGGWHRATDAQVIEAQVRTGVVNLPVADSSTSIREAVERARAALGAATPRLSDGRDPQDLHRWAVAAEVAARYFDPHLDDEAHRDLRTDVHAALCGHIQPDTAAWRAVL